MIRIIVLALLAFNVLVSCVSPNKPYQPLTRAERFEFTYDRLDVYPDDIRKHLDAHTNVPVVWTGIIVSTDAREEDVADKISAETVFEHHYFDWVQDGSDKLALSPRGEGRFSMKWRLDKKVPDATAHSVEKFAKKGRLAIVYGVPEKVEDDGTVVLKYRYLRIVDRDHFTTNDFDYGRLGDAFRVLKGECKTNLASAQNR